MLTYVFTFLAASVLLFQGTQLLGEIKSPLGTVPAEVALPAGSAHRWGERLIGFGSFTLAMGFLSFPYPSLRQYLVPTVVIDGCALTVFAIYLIFVAPRVEYIGKPSEDSHH